MENKVLFEGEMFSDDGRIIVNTYCFGEILSFLVDTSANKNALFWETHSRLADEHDQIPQANISMKNTEVRFNNGYVNLPEIHLSSSNEKNSNYFAQGYDGVLCPKTFLQDGYIIYDFKNAVLKGIEGTKQDIHSLYPKLQFSSVPFKYRSENGSPIVKASTNSLANVKRSYLIDTSSTSTLMPSFAIKTGPMNIMLTCYENKMTSVKMDNVEIDIAGNKSLPLSVDIYPNNSSSLNHSDRVSGILNTEAFIGKVLAIPVRDDLPILLSK